MIDVILGGSIAASIMYTVAIHQPKDVRKINLVFNNIGYRVGNFAPRLRKTRRENDYTEYISEVPPGLVDAPKLAEMLPKTLRNPVYVGINGGSLLRVYNTTLCSRSNAAWYHTE